MSIRWIRRHEVFSSRGLATRDRGARGFSIIEILVALTILSFCLPVFVLSRQNLAADKVHRVRLAAESLCHNTLERFGRPEDDLLKYLAPSDSEPGAYDGTDLWLRPELAADLGATATGRLLTAHEMRMQVRLQRDVADGLDLFECSVSWVLEVGGTKRDSVTYARHVLRDASR